MPALNAKLKDGQVKIIILPPPPPENPKGETVEVDEYVDVGSGISIGNPLLQGVGGSTPS